MSEGAILFLLGAVRCEVDSAEHLLHGEQPRILLTFLGWQHELPVSGDELSAAIWGTGVPSYSPASLRKVVSKVRAFLSDSVGGVVRVENIGGCYRCTSRGAAQIDVAVATDSLARADALRRDGRIEDALEPAGRATDLLRAPLLPGIDREWLQVRRAELLRLRRRSLCLTSQIESHLGAHDDAMDHAAEAVALDPFDEGSHRALITAHLAADDNGGAIVAYEACRRVLLDEFGIRPSAATNHLHDRALGN